MARYNSSSAGMALCLGFDMLCWNIVKWFVIKPVWATCKSIFKLLRWAGKKIDQLAGTDGPAMEYFLGCFDYAVECWNTTEQEDDLSFTPPEYDNHVENSVDVVEEEEEVEDLPFCQLFNIGPDMCVMIDHVEMCPDETAFIRVVDDEGYTPLYKRKVRKDKRGNRYIVFNSENYYLNDSKTKPIVPKK